MKIKNLDISKYKRFFAFGCSFTNYIWPTWADIIGQDIEFYENWGKVGAGNHFIFNSIMECDAKYHFNEDDLVIVMWSGIEREDRYLNNEWVVAVSEEEKIRLYGKSWVNRVEEDYRGFLIRDMAYIKAVQILLQSRNCDWSNMSMYSICKINEAQILSDGFTYKNDLDKFVQRYLKLNRDLCDGNIIDELYACDKDVLLLYKDIYSNIEYSVLDVVRNGYFLIDGQANFGDGHPTPIEHFRYINSILPNNLSKNSVVFVNKWETIVQSIKQKDVMPIQFFRNKIHRL
jgi:hypothetical protein